jgi:hypothetical protein
VQKRRALPSTIYVTRSGLQKWPTSFTTRWMRALWHLSM